jgi:hypothetical protein
VALLMTLLLVIAALAGAAFLLWLSAVVETRQLGPLTVQELRVDAAPEVVSAS